MEKSDGFELWWYNIGSGITPEYGEDQEEHSNRVSRAAYEYGSNNKDGDIE